MPDSFSFRAYRGWQPDEIDKTTLAALHCQEGWEPEWGDGEILIQRRVYAHCACHAIRRFREWQQQGYGDTWLLNQPVGAKCYEYTVVSACQSTVEVGGYVFVAKDP